jgi:hypothetical protein
MAWGPLKARGQSRSNQSTYHLSKMRETANQGLVICYILWAVFTVNELIRIII